MVRILACRVLSDELERLAPSDRIDYFEPLCHSLKVEKFLEYVESMAKGHDLIISGDCGGLAQLALKEGLGMPAAADCIDLLVPGIRRERGALYLTDGWIENLDRIFGLDGLPATARPKVLRTILSGVKKVIYISTPGSMRSKEAQELAESLGCAFESVSGSLEVIASALSDAGK